MASRDENRLADEIAKCYNDPLRYVELAFPWGEKGTPLEKFPEGPDKWHRELFQTLTYHINENIRRRKQGLESKPFKGSVKSGHGIGKAHPYDTYVPTPNGMVRWGDVRPGDELFHPSGVTTKVTECHHFDDLPVWEVVFDDGAVIETSEGHMWTVYQTPYKDNDYRNKLVVSTYDIFQHYKKKAYKWNKYFVEPIQPVDFAPNEISNDPYLMGVWLARGNPDDNTYTLANEPQVDRHLRTIDLTKEDIKLDDDVFSTRRRDRYIPGEYQLASIQARAELVRGMMDAGGHPHPLGSARFLSASRTLCHDLMFVLRSLGVKCSYLENTSGGNHQVNIAFDKDFIYFHDKDKKAKLRHQVEPFTTRRHIIEVRKRKQTENKRKLLRKGMMCVTVDSPDALYLTDDFIPTHNSAGVAWIILWLMSTRPSCKGVVTANTEIQLKTKTWMELAKWHDMAINKHWFELKGTQIFAQGQKDWRFDCIPWSEQNTEAFAGLHNAGSSAVVIFDEASGIPDKIWEVAEGSQTDGEPFWFAFGNPTQNSGRFYECWNKFVERWKGITVDSREVRISNKELIQEWADDYGDDSDFFKVRVLGEFPSAGNKQFISTGSVKEAMARTVEGDSPVVIGVDVARYGDDESVIVVREGRKIDKNLIFRFKGLDLMTMVGHISEKLEKYNPEAVFVDDGGLGGGVVDRLKQLGYNIYGINFSSRASDDKKYANKRAEMWGNMKDWIETGDLPDMDDLRADLTAPEYKFDAKNRILLESKDDMKKRKLRSPDIGDAIGLTFAMKVASRDINRANMKRRSRDFADSDYDIFGGVL